ncbi:hypothetical protein Vafri_14739, partial [Volvox africanus]
LGYVCSDPALPVTLARFCAFRASRGPTAALRSTTRIEALCRLTPRTAVQQSALSLDVSSLSEIQPTNLLINHQPSFNFLTNLRLAMARLTSLPSAWTVLLIAFLSAILLSHGAYPVAGAAIKKKAPPPPVEEPPPEILYYFPPVATLEEYPPPLVYAKSPPPPCSSGRPQCTPAAEPPPETLEPPPTETLEPPPTETLQSPPTETLQSPPTETLQPPPTETLQPPPELPHPIDAFPLPFTRPPPAGDLALTQPQEQIAPPTFEQGPPPAPKPSHLQSTPAPFSKGPMAYLIPLAAPPTYLTPFQASSPPPPQPPIYLLPATTHTCHPPKGRNSPGPHGGDHFGSSPSPILNPAPGVYGSDAHNAYLTPAYIVRRDSPTPFPPGDQPPPSMKVPIPPSQSGNESGDLSGPVSGASDDDTDVARGKAGQNPLRGSRLLKWW